MVINSGKKCQMVINFFFLTFKMAIEIEQKVIESNSNPTLNHLMLCSSEIEADTLTLASLGFHF